MNAVSGCTSNLHAYHFLPAEDQILTDHGDNMNRTSNGERGAMIVIMEFEAESVFRFVVINLT
jgi:hypothetical protein